MVCLSLIAAAIGCEGRASMLLGVYLTIHLDRYLHVDRGESKYTTRPEEHLQVTSRLFYIICKPEFCSRCALFLAFRVLCSLTPSRNLVFPQLVWTRCYPRI